MLTDRTYFAKLVTRIPNQNGGALVAPSSTSTVQDGLTDAIAAYEPEYLRLVLGDDLYEEFEANIDDAKWVAFIAKVRNATTKVSPIANYVFYCYWPIYCTSRTGTGDEMTEGANYRTGQIWAWNEAIALNKRLFVWLMDNRSDYEHDGLELNYDGMSGLLRTDNIFGL